MVAPYISSWSLNPSLEPTTDDFVTIFRDLDAATERVAGPGKMRPVAILLRDKAGATIGGLWGRVIYAWLVIEMLVVPDQMRRQGIGTAILWRAESLARALDCIGMQVTAFDFQAPAFYQRAGFTVFGSLRDLPPGHATLYLSKRLT
jgi:GNAT superfamily N-acetyltransferase